MGNDTCKASVGTGRISRVRANHAVFPPPFNILTRFKWMSSAASKGRPSLWSELLQKADQFYLCGQEIHTTTGERKSLGLLLTPCTHNQGPRDWPAVSFLLRHCPLPVTTPALSLPEVSLDGNRICLALERLCSTMGATTSWVSTTVSEKNWRGQ